MPNSERTNSSDISAVASTGHGGEEWPHTQLYAPYRINANGLFQSLAEGASVAFGASLVHPTLGPIGELLHDGRDGEVEFFPSDSSRFSSADLDTFVAECRHNDMPIDRDGVLREIFTEAETDELVHTMRHHGYSLVRPFTPDPGYSTTPIRGAATTLSRIPCRRDERMALLKGILAGEPLLPDAYWELFDGERWIPLVPEAHGQQSDSTEWFSESLRLLGNPPFACWAITASGSRVQVHVDGTRLFIGDGGPDPQLSKWCACTSTARERSRFELRADGGALICAGEVHRDDDCRSLMRIE
ncbi:hypothetical protein GCM10022247_34660 [Allokutzneria multivorans]|uniref:Uncharacterized protein n=1 Tax=Allokutzneria multivorans TaxID=1142134 RepID=A0ABP7SBS5_9PSEU